MSDNNLVNFGNLKKYDQLNNYKINKKFRTLDSGKSNVGHNHSLKDLDEDDEHKTISRSDLNRLAGFRRCDINANASGNVKLNSNKYDMFYLILTGPVTISIINDRTDAILDETETNNTYARHIKVIIKNPSQGVIWPIDEPSVVWINGELPVPSEGENSVDIVDLFTPDGQIWFGNYMKKWIIN